MKHFYYHGKDRCGRVWFGSRYIQISMATFWGRICLRSPDPVLNPSWIFDIELSPGPNVDLKMRLNAEFKL